MQLAKAKKNNNKRKKERKKNKRKNLFRIVPWRLEEQKFITNTEIQ